MLDRLQPLLDFCQGLALEDAEAARAALDKAFPFAGDYVQELGATLRAGVDDGSLCNRGELPLKFSRVFKPAPETRDFSADVVMMNGAGPLHAHPGGEIDLCFALDGHPSFDGNAPGWTTYAPGSSHVPTVRGGTMLILYLLPGGQIAFEQA